MDGRLRTPPLLVEHGFRAPATRLRAPASPVYVQTAMLERGTTIAGYRIDGFLGQGGMGTVYEATQLSLDRVVALKLLAAHLSGDVGFRARFIREGQVQARLEHPHIVTVYEAGEAEQGLFIAMRLVRGVTLKQLITARELDDQRTLKILEPVADALDEAHAIGLIHRDIKPGNVLVGQRDHSFLADFGLTKATAETSVTKTGQLVGTWDYISPEQINGQPATAASDVYSLAGVFYECLTGVVPYPRPAEAAVLYAHVADPPPRPSAHRPDLPPRLDHILERAMAKDPARRHTSAGELMDEARGALAAAASPAVVGPGSSATALSPTATAPVPVPAQPVPAPPKPVPAHAGDTSRGGIGLFAGGLVAVVLAGFLVGKATSADDPAPDNGRPVSAAGLEFRAPASWQRAAKPVRIPSLPLAGAVSVGPARKGSGGSVTLGRAHATGSKLLPDAFVKRLDADLPKPDAVKLGSLEALRYDDLRPTKLAEGTLRVYVSPTSGGVATVACVVPPAGAGESFTAACDRIAASLEQKAGRSYPLGPDSEYQRELDVAIRRLNDTTRQRTAALHKAATPAAQASAAASLETAYRDAAGSLRGATANPLVSGSNRRIVAALVSLAGGYERLAAAARAEQSGAYASASRSIDRAERALSRALATVGA